MKFQTLFLDYSGIILLVSNEYLYCMMASDLFHSQNAVPQIAVYMYVVEGFTDFFVHDCVVLRRSFPPHMLLHSYSHRYSTCLVAVSR